MKDAEIIEAYKELVRQQNILIASLNEIIETQQKVYTPQHLKPYYTIGGIG